MSEKPKQEYGAGPGGPEPGIIQTIDEQRWEFPLQVLVKTAPANPVIEIVGIRWQLPAAAKAARTIRILLPSDRPPRVRCTGGAIASGDHREFELEPAQDLDESLVLERVRVLRLFDLWMLEHTARLDEYQRERLAKLRFAIELGKVPIDWSAPAT